jgi:predicted DNA-binding transcriptional regulator YafY
LKDTLELLRGAIESSYEVAFLYINLEGYRTERKVHPYTLILKNQSWYLYGWCALRRAFRLIKVLRMRNLRILESGFRRVETDEVPVWSAGDGNNTRGNTMLLLAFDGPAENTVLEWFDEAVIENDGSRLLVRTCMPENGWLYGFLLGFGPSLEILEPKHIRDIVAGMAEEVYKKYTVNNNGI